MESTREPKHDKQSSIKLLRRLGVKTTNDTPNSVASQRNHFVCHDLRAKSEPA
jgi:hypothetical protein